MPTNEAASTPIQPDSQVPQTPSETQLPPNPAPVVPVAPVAPAAKSKTSEPKAPAPVAPAVPEDKTFTHSMDESESVTVKGADLANTVVLEKYLKTDKNTKVVEKMTGAVVALHKDELASHLDSLKRLGNIEHKILHQP